MDTVAVGDRLRLGVRGDGDIVGLDELANRPQPRGDDGGVEEGLGITAGERHRGEIPRHELGVDLVDRLEERPIGGIADPKVLEGPGEHACAGLVAVVAVEDGGERRCEPPDGGVPRVDGDREQPAHLCRGPRHHRLVVQSLPHRVGPLRQRLETGDDVGALQVADVGEQSGERRRHFHLAIRELLGEGEEVGGLAFLSAVPHRERDERDGDGEDHEEKKVSPAAGPAVNR